MPKKARTKKVKPEATTEKPGADDVLDFEELLSGLV
jgi:hypothetical protein